MNATTMDYSLLDSTKDYVNQYSYSQLTVVILGLAWLISSFRQQHPTVPGAKVHGYAAWFEPTFFLRFRFVTQASKIIDSGYKKFKDVPFIIRRYDTDITILPIKYLEEMRLIPRHKLNGKKAQINNLVPRWTWTQVMMDSDLHVKVLNGKLNPDLKKYIDIAKTELEYAWDLDVPQPEEWTEVDIQQSMRLLVARMSAKIFMGHPACRDPEWLKISIDFTFDMFTAAFTLRMFPPWTHWLIAHFIPARWRMRRQIATAKRIVGTLIQQHKADLARGEKGQDTLLNWMYDHGNEREQSVDEMAARQCVLTLASIHTTSLSVANFLFDLCAHPEWMPVLVEEVERVVKEYGMPGERGDITTRQWLQKLEKMDSFLVESQRLNPPILLNPQRIALVPLTLKDGLQIPLGARIAWAGHNRANDPSHTPSPELFNPLRSYNKRHTNSENMSKFTAGQTDSNSMAFGYGGQACPGRYFAVSEIMLMLARLLLEFEFKFPAGKTRPVIMYADENVFIDMHAGVMMRKRRV